VSFFIVYFWYLLLGGRIRLPGFITEEKMRRHFNMIENTRRSLKMWKQFDSIAWTWLNVFMTLFVVVLAVELLSEISITPLAVLGVVIFGWIMFRCLEDVSYESHDLCIGDFEYFLSAFFGFLIQMSVVFMVAGYQWELTGDMLWLYFPLLSIVYWIIQVAYGVAVSYRCVSE
jgi:hypothetical protein